MISLRTASELHAERIASEASAWRQAILDIEVAHREKRRSALVLGLTDDWIKELGLAGYSVHRRKAYGQGDVDSFEVTW